MTKRAPLPCPNQSRREVRRVQSLIGLRQLHRCVLRRLLKQVVKVFLLHAAFVRLHPKEDGKPLSSLQDTGTLSRLQGLGGRLQCLLQRSISQGKGIKLLRNLCRQNGKLRRQVFRRIQPGKSLRRPLPGGFPVLPGSEKQLVHRNPPLLHGKCLQCLRLRGKALPSWQ